MHTRCVVRSCRRRALTQLHGGMWTEHGQVFRSFGRGKKPSHTAGGNAKWYSALETAWQCLRRLDTELAYDPAIPFLGIYLGELKKAHTKTYTRMCIVAMFTTSPKWKRPGSPSVAECLHKRCSQAMEYYSARKRNEVLIPAATG